MGDSWIEQQANIYAVMYGERYRVLCSELTPFITSVEKTRVYGMRCDSIIEMCMIESVNNAIRTAGYDSEEESMIRMVLTEMLSTHEEPRLARCLARFK